MDHSSEARLRSACAWGAGVLVGLAACVAPAPSGGSSDEVPPTSEAPPRESPPPEDPASRHELLTVELAPEGLRVLDRRTVEMPLPRLRGEPVGSWQVVVESAEGKTVFSTRIPPPNVLRGEFAGPDGEIEGVHLEREHAAFPLRTPVLPEDARLRLFAPVESLPQWFPGRDGLTPDTSLEIDSVVIEGGRQ